MLLGPEPDSHMTVSVADNYTNKGMSWLLWLLINYEAVTEVIVLETKVLQS